MLFNPTRGAVERKAKAIIIGGIVVWLAVVGTIVFVAAHFIGKYW